MQNTTSSELYNLLVTKDFDPEILDINGKSINDPNSAEMFSFDWKSGDKNYGTVVALLGKDQDLQIYFGDNISKELEATDKSNWYNFLKQLKTFAARNMLTFDLKNLNRLKYTMQSMSAISEGLMEGYYGNRKVSYSDQPKKTRLVINHSKPLGEGDARYRYIESLFIETSEGEKFKLPFTKLVGGKAMARHVAEGGTPYDEFGKHIIEMVNDMNKLSRFARSTKNKQFESDAADLVETAIRHYNDLKAKAKRMISQRGYYEERETFTPNKDEPISLDEIRDKFIEQNLDNRIEEALPILAKLAVKKEKPIKEIDEFETWAESVVENTEQLNNPATIKKLRDLLSSEIQVGVDGINAIELIYNYIDDDKLSSQLYSLSKKDDSADARPVIAQRLKELNVDIDAGMDASDIDASIKESIEVLNKLSKS